MEESIKEMKQEEEESIKDIETEQKKGKKYYSDMIKCETCDKIYTRSNATAHKRTKAHKIHKEIITAIKESITGYEKARGINDIVRKQYKTKNGIKLMTEKQYKFMQRIPKKYNIL